MNTPTRNPSTVKPGRTVRLAVPPSEDNPFAVITIAERGRAADYTVAPMPSAWGEAFHVAKLGEPDSVYDVHLDRQGWTCECKGFLRWGHCRHLEALTALRHAGKL